MLLHDFFGFYFGLTQSVMRTLPIEKSVLVFLHEKTPKKAYLKNRKPQMSRECKFEK
jgi:hypothetical protein